MLNLPQKTLFFHCFKHVIFLLPSTVADSNIPPCLHLLQYELEFVVVFLALLQPEDDDPIDDDNDESQLQSQESRHNRSRHTMFSFASVRNNPLLIHREGN